MEISKFLKSKGMSNKTIKIYTQVINKISQNLGKDFGEEELENYLAELNLSPRTYNLYRSIMNFYTTKYLNYSLTFKKAKLDDSLPSFVSEEEFKKVLDTIPNWKHNLILKVMYQSGLRISEAVRLKKYQVNTENLTILVKEGKGKKDRYTIIPKNLAPEFIAYFNKLDFKEKEFIFPAFREHITEASIQERLKKAIKDSDSKHFTAHDLRHSFAINLVNKGIDLEILRRLLGHYSIKTTQIYLKSRTIDLTKIANLL